jgi:hypothetical protein
MLRDLTGKSGEILAQMANKPTELLLEAVAPRFAEDIGVGNKISYEGVPFLERYAARFTVRQTAYGRRYVDKFYDKHKESLKAWKSHSQRTRASADRWLEDRENWKRLHRYHALDSMRSRLSNLHARARKAAKSGDHKEMVEVSQRVVEAAKEGLKRADLALKDPKIREAYRVDWEEGQRKKAVTDRRLGVRGMVESFVDHKGYSDLAVYIRSLHKEDQKWALGIAERYEEQLDLDPLQRRLKRVPKKHREEVGGKAIGRPVKLKRRDK